MPRYIQVADDYELQDGQSEYKPEDTTGLKNKANELLAESKKKDATVAELNATIKQLQVDLNSGASGDAKKIQAQLDDAIKQNTELRTNNENMVKANNKGKINLEATRIASELTKHVGRRDDLALKIASRLQLDGDKGFTVLDTNGNPTISTTNDLVGQIREKYDWLVDGSQASGGGAQGGSGGAGDTKTMKRSDFDAMSVSDQGKHMSSGGTLTDD